MGTDPTTDQEELLAEYRQKLSIQRMDASVRRRDFYADTERLLTEGFLFSSVDLGGTLLTLRTLPANRVNALRARSDIFRAPGDVIRWVVASSVWMIDGCDVFDDKNTPYHLMSEFLRDLRHEFVGVLGYAVSALRLRVERATAMTESYCYEPYARAYWRLLGKQDFFSDDNPVRRIWVAHNLSEDEYVDDLRRWEHTRSQVSSMSNRGGQHLTRELERLKTREEDRRQKHIENTFRVLRYGDDPREAQKVVIRVGGEDIEVEGFQSALSFDELDAQMRRMVEGRKDAHDLVVDEYMRQIQERVEQRKIEYEQALASIRAREDYMPGVSGGTSLVGYTPEQLSELGVSEARGLKVDGAKSAIADHLYEKIVGNDIRAGWISTANGPEAYGVDSGATPLQDKIAARKPGIGGVK